MPNFFTENEDIVFNFNTMDLVALARLAEENFRFAKEFDYAPDSAEDAIDNYLAECATTLLRTARDVEAAPDESTARLPAPSGTTWRELARTGKGLAEELLPLALARQKASTADQDAAIRERLSKIAALLVALPSGGPRTIESFRAAAEYGAWAARLMRTD